MNILRSSIKKPLLVGCALFASIVFFSTANAAWIEKSTLDRMTDKTTRYFELKGTGSRYISHLIVYCEGSASSRWTTMALSFPARAGYRELKGRIRFDDNHSRSRQFNLSSDGHTLWLNEQSATSANRFLAQALKSQRLLVEVERFDGTDLMEYQLNGLSDIVRKLHCR